MAMHLISALRYECFRSAFGVSRINQLRGSCYTLHGGEFAGMRLMQRNSGEIENPNHRKQQGLPVELATM